MGTLPVQEPVHSEDDGDIIRREADSLQDHHHGHEATDDHGQDGLLPLLGVLLDLGLGQLLDWLKEGDHGDVEGLAHPELVPDLHPYRVCGAWGRESEVRGK